MNSAIIKKRPVIVLVVMVFAAGSLAAGVGFAAYTDDAIGASPKTIAVDTNRDGKPDRWENYENGQVQRVDLDRNGDGKIDQIMHYENGKIKKIERDTTFSGKIDQWIDY